MVSVKDDDIGLSELIAKVWAAKWFVIGTISLFLAASIFIALSLPNVYRASVLLAPVSNGSGSELTKLAGQFGGLASLAGINLSGGIENDKSALALEILGSRAFIEYFIDKNELLIPLMGSEKWDIRTQKLVFDKDVYNAETKEWVRDVSFPKTPKPSPWESYEYFRERLSINQDDSTGMVILSFDFYSPLLAREWLEELVREINFKMKTDDSFEAKERINYLEKQLEETSLAGMKSVFYQLIEEQTKSLMLSQVSQEYVFKTIDPANVPDKKHSPKRALLVVIGTFLGGLVSTLVVFVRLTLNNKSAELE